jgi:hypothetical protein
LTNVNSPLLPAQDETKITKALASSAGNKRCFILSDSLILSGHLIAEATSTRQTVREYIWLGDMPIAVVADVDTLSPQLWFVHADHLDRPIKMTNSSFRPHSEEPERSEGVSKERAAHASRRAFGAPQHEADRDVCL